MMMSHALETKRVRFTILLVTIAVSMFAAGCGALVGPSAPAIQATYSTQVPQNFATPNASNKFYASTLTTGGGGWSTDPVCKFSSQGLTVAPASGQAYICLAPTAPIADAGISVTVRQLSGSTNHAFGLVFRHSAPKSYYFFGVDGRGRYTLDVVVNDVSHTVVPFTVNPAIHSGVGTSNTLQVVIRGQQATLIVNGTPVG